MRKYLDSGREVIIVNEFKYKDEDFCVYYVNNSWGDLEVIQTVKLRNEEETYIFVQRAELERLKKEQAVEVKKIQDKAIKGLVMRMKLNSAFGDNKGDITAWALTIAGKLEELIKGEEGKQI